ncbi:hypothetical protein D3C84_737220 [compost metagenome]
MLFRNSSKPMPSTESLAFTPAAPTEPVTPVVVAAPVANRDTVLAATASATSCAAPRLIMEAVTIRPIVALAASPVIPPLASVGISDPTPCAIFIAQTSISPAPSPRVMEPEGDSLTRLRVIASRASTLIPSLRLSAPD